MNVADSSRMDLQSTGMTNHCFLTLARDGAVEAHEIGLCTSVAHLVNIPKSNVENEIQFMSMCDYMHISRDEIRTIEEG